MVNFFEATVGFEKESNKLTENRQTCLQSLEDEIYKRKTLCSNFNFLFKDERNDLRKVQAANAQNLKSSI